MPDRTTEAPVATLIADGGMGAASEQHFFRSPQYLQAEGVTHTLTITAPDRLLVAPFIVREITVAGTAGELQDAISPYGYPGMALAGTAPESSPEPLDPSPIDWSATGLVSAFIRHQAGTPLLSGTTARNTLQIADPRLDRKSRMSDRQQIRKNAKAGYEVEQSPGPESEGSLREDFFTAYTQTMVRTEAAERYFFSREYFDLILSAPSTRLFLVRGPQGDIAAASIATRSDGFLHYFLSGTADAHLRQAPMKSLLDAMVDHSIELGLALNLGGGITPGDKLEEFKRGFANRREDWHTSELICEPATYDRLGAKRRQEAEAGPVDPAFFPSYRSPG